MDISATVVISIVTPLASAALIIWRGGVQVGRVESAIKRLSEIESKLIVVDELKVKVTTLEYAQTRFQSDFRQLERRVEKVSDRMRGEHPSIVDDEERR